MFGLVFVALALGGIVFGAATSKPVAAPVQAAPELRAELCTWSALVIVDSKEQPRALVPGVPPQFPVCPKWSPTPAPEVAPGRPCKVGGILKTCK
jgi:hypothetical protein